MHNADKEIPSPPTTLRLRASGEGVRKKYPVIAKLVDGSIAGRQYAMEVGDWIINVNGTRLGECVCEGHHHMVLPAMCEPSAADG